MAPIWYWVSPIWSDLPRFGNYSGSSLKTRPGHVKIAVDITAVDIDLFLLYSTGTMIIYDSFSLYALLLCALKGQTLAPLNLV